MSDRNLLPVSRTNNKRRNPLNNISNSINTDNYRVFENKRTKLKQPIMTTAVMLNMDFNGSNNEVIYKNKMKKQSQLKLIQSHIWENQKVLSNLKIKYDDYEGKITILKRDLELLQLKISSLNSYKLQKTKSSEEEFQKFKQNLQEDLNNKINSLNTHYEKLAYDIIEKNLLKFKNLEKSLVNQIKILNNSIKEDFSEEKLEKRKLDIETKMKKELEDFVKIKNKNIIELKRELDVRQNEVGKLKDSISSIEANINSQLKPAQEILSIKITELNTEMKYALTSEDNLKNQLGLLDSLNKEESNKLLSLKELNRSYQNELISFEKQIQNEEQYRRFLHEKLQELKGNIRVFCRIKPDDPNNTFSYKIQSLVDLKESLVIQESKTNGLLNSNQTTKSLVFSFDKIFDKTSSNGDIFQEISQLVQSSLDGFDVCIFTYGQTGSGKTFTMSNLNDGLIPRSLNLMFNKMNENEFSGFKLYGQFFEIYGDTVKDLIGKNFSVPFIESEVEITNLELSNIIMVELSSINQIDDLLGHANKKRTTAATMANNVSSRSHSIFKVYITKFNTVLKKYTIISTLNLIDLAGSERLNRSKVTGDRLKETLSINKSLSSLGDVISSLKSNSNHIPYRNSKLTYLLKDSLGGNSKTLMFVNISCLSSHLNESLSSLRFANKVNETVLK